MKKINFYILFLGLILVKAHAAPICNVPAADQATKKVNLINEMPPMRDQDSIGWCYGFTTADLLTHYLYKTKGRNIRGNFTPFTDYRLRPFNVSPMGISSMYNESNKNTYGDALKNQSTDELKRNKIKVVAEGGTLPNAMKVIKDRGFCFERDVSSEDFSYVTDSRCAINSQCSIEEIVNIIYDSPKERIECNDLHTLQKVFKTLNLPKIRDILVHSAKKDALTNLVNASCKKKITNTFISNQLRYETRTIQIGQSSNELMKFLDNHLDRGIPVGIMYYADFLTGTQGRNFAHASSIVGKEFNPETCEVEYILRNSWGRGCGYYVKENPRYAACTKGIRSERNAIAYAMKLNACKKAHSPIPRNPRIRCQEPSGYIYVRKSDLANQIFNTTAIQEDLVSNM